MKTIRSIERVIAPPPPHMVGDGFRVHNFFPSGGIQSKQRMSPFFMLDYASKFEFPPSKTPRGVDVHPHRGFETVTIAYHGKIAHHDSAGNKGVIEEGDVQWMTAGRGVQNCECFRLSIPTNRTLPNCFRYGSTCPLFPNRYLLILKCYGLTPFRK